MIFSKEYPNWICTILCTVVICMYVSYPFRGSVTYFIALFLTVVLGFSFSCFKSAELYWVSAHFISGKLHLRIFKLGELTYNRSYQGYLELLKINEICLDCIKLCLSSLSFSYRIINPSTKTMVFCYQNCSDQLWEKNVSVIEKNFLEFKAEGQEFAKFLRSLEQFIQTVKGQNNFWQQNAFLTCSWRFLISNESEQLEFKLENIVGI